jgi:hypothetical protein
MEKQRGQDLGQKTMFFHPKIPKICVTWVKSEKGTISYPHRPMFKISWKNCEPSQRYGPDKTCVKKKKERRKNNDKNNSLPLRGRLITTYFGAFSCPL